MLQNTGPIRFRTDGIRTGSRCQPVVGMSAGRADTIAASDMHGMGDEDDEDDRNGNVMIRCVSRVCSRPGRARFAPFRARHRDWRAELVSGH